MLNISQNQMDIMANHLDEQFIEKMASYILSLTKKPTEAVTMSELKKSVRTIIARAKSYGYTKQQDVYYFLEIILMCGSNFDSNAKYDWLTASLQNNATGTTSPIKPLYNLVKNNKLKENEDLS